MSKRCTPRTCTESWGSWAGRFLHCLIEKCLWWRSGWPRVWGSFTLSFLFTFPPCFGCSSPQEFPFATRRQLSVRCGSTLVCTCQVISRESRRASWYPSISGPATGCQLRHLHRTTNRICPTWRKWSCQSFMTLSSSIVSWVLIGPATSYPAL